MRALLYQAAAGSYYKSAAREVIELSRIYEVGQVHLHSAGRVRWNVAVETGEWQVDNVTNLIPRWRAGKF